jgi:hypothetical protein
VNDAKRRHKVFIELKAYGAESSPRNLWLYMFIIVSLSVLATSDLKTNSELVLFTAFAFI